MGLVMPFCWVNPNEVEWANPDLQSTYMQMSGSMILEDEDSIILYYLSPE